MTPQKEPVAWSNVIAAILSLLSLVVAMGWLSLSGEQFTAIEQALGAAGVVVWPLLAGLWARSQVTPLAEPKTVDGEKLVRASGDPTPPKTRSIARGK